MRIASELCNQPRSWIKINFNKQELRPHCVTPQANHNLVSFHA